MAKWLTAKFKLVEANSRGDNYEAFLAACENGHAATAEWVAETFGLTVADVCVHNNRALYRACSAGYFETATWLVRTFSLAADEARAAFDARARADEMLPKVKEWIGAVFG